MTSCDFNELPNLKVALYEPHLAESGSFFSFVYQAFHDVKGAELTSRPRPVPQMREPREHVSAWMEIDGALVLLDMSDHVFLIDLPALRKCDCYFKTNFHRETAEAVLSDTGEAALLTKMRPFFSFAGYLHAYLKPSCIRNVYERFFGQREDVCDVVGVYEHLRREGERSVYDENGPEIIPNRVHYWARVHTLEALKSAGLTGTLRLTSRYQTGLEDGELIFPNLSQRAYRRAILRSKMLVINTLPHALLPWKATESLALGRPFIVDVPPLTEFPAPFQLREGDHYLRLLPPASFSSNKDGRVLHSYRMEDFQEGAARVAEVLRDAEKYCHMKHEVEEFRKRALHPQTIVEYICNELESVK